MATYWSQEEPLEGLCSADYGKLNVIFTFRIVMKHHHAFDQFVYRNSDEVVKASTWEDKEYFLMMCQEILCFERVLRIPLYKDLDSVAKNPIHWNLIFLNGKTA